MQRILQGIDHFQRHVHPAKRELFQRLASGQNPEALFVCCSDSRLALDLITQTGPGDIFVCRNAGNIVPAPGEGDSVSATIEYAVSALKIRHIVICGHSDCGAMKGLLKPEALAQMPDVKRWLEHAQGAYRALECMNSPEPLDTLTRLNVRLQLDHLRSHPHVFAQVQAGRLTLHGWVYDIRSGAVEAWSDAQSAWMPVAEAYPGNMPAAAGAHQEVQHA